MSGSPVRADAAEASRQFLAQFNHALVKDIKSISEISQILGRVLRQPARPVAEVDVRDAQPSQGRVEQVESERPGVVCGHGKDNGDPPSKAPAFPSEAA